MDYFHYCNAKDSDDEGSMQTTQDGDYLQGEKRKQPPCRDPPHVKIPSRNFGEKSEPPCRDHPSLDKAYLKFDKEQNAAMCNYVATNPKHFCKTCGLNLKYTQYLYLISTKHLLFLRTIARFAGAQRERFVMCINIKNIIVRLV
jgi:hypothetical protein